VRDKYATMQTAIDAAVPTGYLLMVWNQNLSYLDSPATTSAITYGVQVSSLSTGTYINRTGSDTDAADMYRGVSYITVMEIAA
jgi:hypothetical protein